MMTMYIPSYPHLRGAYIALFGLAVPAVDLSPLTWGVLTGEVYYTTPVELSPRVWGDSAPCHTPTTEAELSPHTWGLRFDDAESLCDVGVIPTCVGRTGV